MELSWVVMCVMLVYVMGELAHGDQRKEKPYPCQLYGRRFGVCVPFYTCSFSRNFREEYVPYCGFDGRYPLVCCPKNKYKKIPKAARKCKEKCQQYININHNMHENDLSSEYDFEEYSNLTEREFPHMAALGYGSPDRISWLCGGSLISERFILTAAHCLVSVDVGEVQYVRLGDSNLTSTLINGRLQQYNVARRIKHPDYLQPSLYHDIALIELDRPVKFTDYVRPACLHVSKDLSGTVPIATGWGSQYGIFVSDHLKKVELEYFDNQLCRVTYGSVRRLADGVVDDLQICAGSSNEQDTCQGDSGGPLQIQISSKPSMYNIIGITSFGKSCGIPNTPGVYTRVSNYVNWIEEIVWPSENF